MSDTIRVAVVLENGGDAAAVEAGLLADVRRVEVEGVIAVADTTPSPVSLPEDLVAALGLTELTERLWGGRRCAGPLVVRIGGRRTLWRLPGRTGRQSRPDRPHGAAPA